MYNEPYPIIQVAGSPYEIGKQHGQLAQERVAKSVDIYKTAFRRSPGIEWPAVLERARGFAETIAAADPDIFEEMRGIADGAGFQPEEIVAINCRTEILFGRKADGTPPHECTTIASTPAASRGGKTLLGKNWDWRAECLESVVIIQARPDNGPAFVLMVEAGMVGRDGMNEHGIAITGNLLRSRFDGRKPGVPVPLIRRRALNSRRLDDAISAITKAERAASTNYVLAHESGIIIDFEASPEDVYPVYPERGLLTHSNHFLHTAAVVQGVGRDVGADSLYRHQRARDLLEAKIGDITVDDIQAALRDHAGRPKSICRHPDERDPEQHRSASIASVVFDLDARVMHIASGPPCCNEYRAVGLPGVEEVVGVGSGVRERVKV